MELSEVNATIEGSQKGKSQRVSESNGHSSSATNNEETRQPLCDPLGLSAAVTDVLRRIKQARGRPLFVLISDEIDYATCEEIYRWKRELSDIGKADNLDLLIHSPGGVLTECYHIARLLSHYCKQWEALVPSVAMSGATLICLGSSRIVLTPFSRLGPLDPQVISKRPGKFFALERQSPLEAFQALRYLREISLTELNATLLFLLDHGIAPQTALETARELAGQLVQPMLGKIDPYDLGAFRLDSQLSLGYCERIANPASLPYQTQREANYSVLVEKYPAHEFIIDLHEAHTLGLNVCEATEQVSDLFDELRVYLSSPSKPGLTTYIGLVPDETGEVTP